MMKLTIKKLKQMIKEEVGKVNEAKFPFSRRVPEDPAIETLKSGHKGIHFQDRRIPQILLTMIDYDMNVIRLNPDIGLLTELTIEELEANRIYDVTRRDFNTIQNFWYRFLQNSDPNFKEKGPSYPSFGEFED